MVWSGGNDWENIDADLIALASYVPGNVPSDLAPLFYNICPGLPDKQKILSKKAVVISFGGSAAYQTNWKSMESSGIASWVNLFKKLKSVTGINGIDWDLENCPGEDDDTFWSFVGSLSKELKTLGMIVTFTVFGNVNNPQIPPDSFFTDYSGDEYVDYLTIMLYGSKMWDHWTSYALDFFQKFPQTQKKLILDLYPVGTPFDWDCVNNSTSLIENGDCVGISFWCYGGYLGGCTNLKTNVKKCIDTLNKVGTDQWNCLPK